MARYEDDYDDTHRRTRQPTREERAALRSNTMINYIVIIGAVIALFAVGPFLFTLLKERIGLAPTPTEQSAPAATPAHPAIGGQAPPAVRSTNPDALTLSTPLPNVAQNEATAQTLYQAAIEAQNGAQPASTPVLAPLPLNSAGQPIIDQRQQQQLDQSAELAAQEAAAAVRAAQLADAQSRAPDVSADQVATMTGRPPCSVPHSDPQTCAQGLYKPTPIN